ncbi:hypothetical protein IW140_002878 [Coemansia sp. RSA 1813]|nr:hypothetical protein EV178_002798 [Coemansia sp. RSA 1646]KAJ1771062.1 hypothetical protein LPJ74_002649 [Coemansia sp. RSA 1843]KAJ2089807.1 hypothetical protein IW138_003101 [Coemansia sp. RSA 986]KAJ2214808.1 hypothetical protein EV179_002756 [Coemansia sp. RSA 487]KAJ2569797.1 hypothetical protein IW140_002878 [Coemansia sp. RSA 1813]
MSNITAVLSGDVEGRQQQTVLLNVPAGLVRALRECESCPFALPKTDHGVYHRTCFATMSRLLTCLVNEQLVCGWYVSCPETPDASFLLVSSSLCCYPPMTNGEIWSAGSLVFQLRHRPIVDEASDSRWNNVRHVRMLDPEDLGVWVWRTSAVDLEQGKWMGTVVTSPLELLKQMAEWNKLDQDVVCGLRDELESSMTHQMHAFAYRKDRPAVTLQSSAIEWEQSIVEGHATHPMHRSRYAVPPLQPLLPSAELHHIELRFVAVSRDRADTAGDYNALLMPLFEAAHSIQMDQEQSGSESVSSDAKRLLDCVDLDNEVVVPVHELHLPAVKTLFPFARELPFAAPAEAQASLRTVSPQALEGSGLDIKLPLGVKTSSALRTVSPWSAHLGPRLTPLLPLILDRGAEDERQNVLLVAGEPASAIVRDHEMAKYLACIVRHNTQALCGTREERAIVAAALTERNAHGTSVVQEQWELDTEDKAQAFLRTYVRLLFAAFLPPILAHGFAFEAHQQNTLVRVDVASGRVLGFVIRDFGGVMVHPETFRRSTGHELPMLPGNSTTARTMDEVYDVAYHTLIQCHINRLVRALGLHYSGSGWAIVREELARAAPADSELYAAWMESSTVRLKSFIAMKLGGLYRDYLYTNVPNLLHYRSEYEQL